MSSTDRPFGVPAISPGTNTSLWGSDPIAGLLRALDIPFIALTPGASFRGLHDSLVNYLGNERPEMLLCLHEEHAVSIAHGWARVTGKPLAVALHSNVGLMHATMAIFNAWCDRMPMLILGAVGPVDAPARRPWVDWIHTSSDLASLVRGYTKWDNQPASVEATLEAILRAHQITTSEPRGPVFVCLDAAVQEKLIEGMLELPDVGRFRAASPAEPPEEAVKAAVEALSASKRPLVLVGRVSADMEDWSRRIELVERLQAPVLTDIKTGARFPTTHRLHASTPELHVTDDAGALIREADVILSLDWVDLGGTLRRACGGTWPQAKVIQCSLDQHLHNGWSMDHQMLPPADITMLASPDRLVARLLDRMMRARPGQMPDLVEPAPATPAEGDGPISVDAFAETIAASLSGHRPSYIRLPLGWPGEHCRFEHPLDYIGYDGGGGLASGPGMAIGAALALKDSGRLPVAIVGDGDFMMGVTAIWTAVHHRIPVLMIVANNQSFFNDELHQERVAVMRGRPVENRGIGLRMTDPPLDMAKLAEGQGAMGIGPITTVRDLRRQLETGVRAVHDGAVCILDVRVAAEYSRALSSTLLRHLPTSKGN